MLLSRRDVLRFAGIFPLAALFGCTTQDPAEESETDLTVGASHTPHALILNGPVRELLEAEGYHLDVIEYEGYDEPNSALAEGELDATFYEHRPFLDEWNGANGANLESLCAVHYEPMGIYSQELTSMGQVEKGATVAIPADPANRARALLLLEQERLITLSDDAGTQAVPANIVENRRDITLTEVPAEELSEQLSEVDLVVMPGNIAMENGHSPSDALAAEPLSSLLSDVYENLLVVRAGEGEKPKLQALAQALTSQEVHDYIEQSFGGNVVPVFQPPEPTPEGE